MVKSLEIVNKLLEKINQYDDWFLTEMEAEQIKQDLEVLEIIRNKRVDMKLFAMFCVALTNEEILFSYNSNCSYEDEKLTMEELLKLKQWLEENENDR